MDNMEYVIRNFLKEYVCGYYNSGMAELSCFLEDAIVYSEVDAIIELDKLHKMGLTGLWITEYKRGLYD